MAAQREPAWTTHEKNALLAEIIKVNNPPPNVLLNIINSMHMSPRLEEIPLPPGRSLISCRNALDGIHRDATATTPGSMSIQSSSPMSAPLTQGKRPFPFENTPLQPGRTLAPKPMTGMPYGHGLSQIEQPPKKKRGRPTKAEAQAKAEAQSMAGEASSAVRQPIAMAPMATPTAPRPPELPQPAQTPVESRRESMPAVSRMNISSMLAATPTGPGSGSHSSSSSGKRRRARSTRSEPGAVPLAGTVGEGAEQSAEYESPYARMGGETIDSPARAAMMRRREEPRMDEQQQPGGQQQPPAGHPPQQQSGPP